MTGNHKKPILCYVTDRHGLAGVSGLDDAESTALLTRSIDRAIAAGVDWIQVREKDLEARPLEALVRGAVRASAGHARILVNDRLDVAIASGAAGVHLGEASLPVARVAAWRAGAGLREFAIGASCHSLDAIRAAERDGAEYIIFGPVFATPSKASFGPPQGLARLADACRDAHIPVLAIGGVTESNAAACLEAGAAGVAAIGLFQHVSNEGDLAGIVSRLHGLTSAKVK
jgi:thiamine-phosphate pyrophosphorylase